MSVPADGVSKGMLFPGTPVGGGGRSPVYAFVTEFLTIL